MLVLTRKQQQQIQIGEGVTITILKVKGNAVRIGIEAPADVKIVRSELEPEGEGSTEKPNGNIEKPRFNQMEAAGQGAPKADAAAGGDYQVLSFRVRQDDKPSSVSSPRAASMRDFLAMRSASPLG